MAPAENVLIGAYRNGGRSPSVPDLGKLMARLDVLDNSSSSSVYGPAATTAGQLSDGAAADLDPQQAHSIEELTHMTRKPHYRAAIMACPRTLATLVRLLGSGSPAVARFAAAALQNLAIEPEHCAPILAAGALAPLLRLLVSAPDGAEALLGAAVGALSNLAYDEGACQRIAKAPGAILRLVGLLSHSSAVVREAGASALAKVAFEPELCAPIADAGAVKPLVSLLSSDLSDDGGRQVAAAALENLTYDSAPNRKAVADQGGIPLLVSLLDSGCEAAQRSAAGALHNLALARPNVDKIAAAGGVEPLVGLLENGASEAVQAVAGGALGKLAADPAARAEIVVVREKLVEEAAAAGAEGCEHQHQHQQHNHHHHHNGSNNNLQGSA